MWAIDYTWPRFTIPSTLWQFGGYISPDSQTATLDSDASKAPSKYWHDLMYTHGVCRPEVPGKPWAATFTRLTHWPLCGKAPGRSTTSRIIQMWPSTRFGHAVRFARWHPSRRDRHTLCVSRPVSPTMVSTRKKLIKWLSDNGKTWATSGQIPRVSPYSRIRKSKGSGR